MPVCFVTQVVYCIVPYIWIKHLNSALRQLASLTLLVAHIIHASTHILLCSSINRILEKAPRGGKQILMHYYTIMQHGQEEVQLL